VFTQFGIEDMSGLLHERVSVAAAFDDARFEAAGTLADSAGGDVFQEFIGFPLQSVLRHQAARMHGPPSENELTGAGETYRARFLLAPQCCRGGR